MNDKHSIKMTLGQLLAKVSRLVGGRMRSKMRELGLHRAQGFILSQLWHLNGTPQNELAQSLNITPATITKTLQRMERDGWIERRRDELDQRIVRVFLADKARLVHDGLHQVFRHLDEEMTAALSDEERETLRGLLFKVNSHLSAGMKSFGVPVFDEPGRHGDEDKEAS